MKYPRPIFVVLAAFAFAGPAQAIAQDINNDVRCMMVSNAFAKNAKEAKAKEAASSTMIFYAGRVSAVSDAQIGAALVSQQKQITAANAPATMKSCAQAADRAMKNIQAVGQKSQPPKG